MRFRTTTLLALVLLALGCDKGRPLREATEQAHTDVVAGAPGTPATMPAPRAFALKKSNLSEVAVTEGAATPMPPFAADTSTANSSAANPVVTSMIIRNGEANIEVDSLTVGMTAITQLARRIGGYIANTQVQTGHDQTHSATLEIKVPTARFDDALTGLRAIGKLESVNVTAEDVGEEYVDVNARVANARRLEQRLVELLANRTGKLSDVLQVERELARVREEIERYEGRLRYLRAHAAVSTLSVTVHEPLPVVGERGSESVLAESFRQAWRNFVNFVAGFIASLGTLIPLIVVLAAAGFGVVKTTKKLRGVNAPAQPLTPAPKPIVEG